MWFDDEFFDFRKFQRQMQRAMKSAFKDFQVPETPLTDITETENEVVVRLDIPGIDKKDIQILASPESIEVKAEKKGAKIKAGKQSYKEERSMRSYHRVIPMPVRIDPKHIKAEYKDGVLTLKVAKKEKVKKIKIRVK